MPRGSGVVGGQDIGRHHHVRFGQVRRRLKGIAVHLDCLQRRRRCDVIRRDERQSERTGHACALALAAAEDPRPQRGPLPRGGVRLVSVDPVTALQQCDDVGDLITEIGCHGLGLLQGRHDGLQPWIAQLRTDVVRGGNDHAVPFMPKANRARLAGTNTAGLAAALSGAAHTQIDAARVEGVQRREALHDRDGGGVPELHRAGADRDGVGGGRDLADEHRRGGAGHRGVVVLGHPVAAIAPPFGVPGEVDGVAQGGDRVATRGNRGEVEDRQRNTHVSTFWKAIGKTSRCSPPSLRSPCSAGSESVSRV